MLSPLLYFICVSLLLSMQSWCLRTSSLRPSLTSSSSNNATVHTLAQNTLKYITSSNNITEYETHMKKMARRLIIIRCCGHRSCSPSKKRARKLAIARVNDADEVSITCPTCQNGWQTLLNLKTNTSQGIPVKCLQCPPDWKSRLDFTKVDLWGDPRVLTIGLIKKSKISTVKVKNVTTTTTVADDTSDDTSDTDTDGTLAVTSTMKPSRTTHSQTKVQTMQTVSVTTKAITLTNITTVRPVSSIATGSTLRALLSANMTVFRATVTATTRRVTTTTEEITTDSTDY